MQCKFVYKVFYAVCLFFFMLLSSISTAQASANIKEMRIGNQANGTRIVFEIDKKINYRTFLLDTPKRLVVDFDDVNIGKMFTGATNHIIAKTRVGKLENNSKRIVFELAQTSIIKKAFTLPPQSGKPWRLVIDVQPDSENSFKKHLGNKHAFTNDTAFQPKDSKESNSWWASSDVTSNKNTKRKKIIVLDPGHGGKDPGAIGAYGKTYEKNITLAMARELRATLKKKGYIVYLTRDKDVFIPLRQRTKIAQKYKADLFMSLHADSAKNRRATGLSVYTLSDTASDKEAAALADRENKADIIGGVDLGGNSKEVNDILISLSQTDSRNKSSKYATYLVKEMAKSVKLLKNTHRFAGFAVLKAPDIPSVLLEMGYLSNRTEEANLKRPAYRKKLADSAARAIDKYFNDPEIASN